MVVMRFRVVMMMASVCRQRYELSLVPGADAENGDAQVSHAPAALLSLVQYA